MGWELGVLTKLWERGRGWGKPKSRAGLTKSYGPGMSCSSRAVGSGLSKLMCVIVFSLFTAPAKHSVGKMDMLVKKPHPFHRTMQPPPLHRLYLAVPFS